ncbi:MAG: c-type cytochrome, partial [Leeuwenhoekiella sp.]
ACLEAVGTKNNKIALWTLRYMHDPNVVDGLIGAYDKTENKELKSEILSTLARLYQKETEFEGNSWWGTRPDTHGPYYNATTWESSDKIKKVLMDAQANDAVADNQYFGNLNKTLQLGIEAFDQLETQIAKNALKKEEIDLDAIKSKKGQVGEASIEDVIRALDKYEGDPEKGRVLFDQQGCIACHSVSKGENLKGPYMGQIGSIMNRVQIAESILKPNASISQGFATVLIKTIDDKALMGFVTAESANEIEIRDITGKVTKIDTKNIAEREEMPNSMMPAGLASALSFEEFSSLVTFLSKQK